ncbi:putative Sel1-like repeat-containing protein [Cotonvirus japonicus]|uniref:Sel1-like repeat-containing protein n=1 Tax=Cotonvirus japonicus TaxID=2811091 RepID=A0ABM7NQW3_9VIRU|nr:putative Sel1-like repeat-containing protein [Cotonvirus japonicus]BCS82540.1 putative Sel1-like repeat-containing protein [Cotonvirus japonicus]
MYTNCDQCGLVIYSEIYHKCIKSTEKNSLNIKTEVKPIDYKLLTIDELGILADTNDRNAQDEIVFRYLNQGAMFLSKKNINPINWQNLTERSVNDQYFTYFLSFFSQFNGYENIFNIIFEDVKLAAKTGDSMAQHNLGLMYYEGLCTKKNIKKAIKWITKSANQNNKYALINLAGYYEAGDIIPLDIEKAIKLLELAVNQNLSSARYYLGKIYMHMKPPDHALAFKYYQEAANQNHCEAQFWIGIYYKTGHSVTKDYQMALHWLTLAANQGLNSAKIRLAGMYILDTYVERNYDKAFELLNSSIYDDGTNNYYDNIAMLELSRMYQTGTGVEKDMSKAIYLLVKSKINKKITKTFKINTITFINPINVDYDNINIPDIDEFESRIIYKLQSIMIKFKYENTSFYNIEIENTLQEIENKFYELVNLRTQINKSSVMITCLSFKKNARYKLVDGKNTYINKYELNDIPYLSIGEENVKLTDNIFEILKQYEFNNLLQDLKLILENKHKEKIDILVNSVEHGEQCNQLDIVKDLEKIKNFLSLTEKISSKLATYKDLFIDDIKNNTHLRNQNFQQEYPFIFGYEC